MKITRKFTTAGSDPFASVNWVKRSSKITNPDGSRRFPQRRLVPLEVPYTESEREIHRLLRRVPHHRAGHPQRGAPFSLLPTHLGAENR